MQEITIKGVKIQYDAGNVRIVDSYKVTSEGKMIDILMQFKRKTNFKSKRKFNSWIREWKAHNRLYRLGLFLNHTADCDLEELEKWYRLLAYFVIGI